MNNWVVGIHAVSAALKAGAGKQLIVREGRLSQRQQDVIALAEINGVAVYRQDFTTELVD